MLGLRFCARAFSPVAESGGHSLSQCAGLSLSRPLSLRSTGSRRAGSVVVAHRPSCSAACGIFPDQGSNPCPLHWQADSQPLRHQGSPTPWGFKAETRAREVGEDLRAVSLYVFQYLINSHSPTAAVSTPPVNTNTPAFNFKHAFPTLSPSPSLSPPFIHPFSFFPLNIKTKGTSLVAQ